MKDFWEDLGKRIGETAENMTAMAGDAIEIQRLKSQVRNLARGNAVDLMELGRTIYDRYKAGEEVEESAKALCDAIKDRSECPKCGKMVAKDMAYCPYCGEKVEKINAEPADEDAADEYAEDAAGETVEEAGETAEEPTEEKAE